MTTAADQSQSPRAPPISPITPPETFAQPAAPISKFSPDPPTSPRTKLELRAAHVQHNAGPTFIPQPPSVTLSEDDNIDAIALRAAIYTLQIQKDKSIRDIHTLQKLKTSAAQDPERFLDDYTAGCLRHEKSAGDPLAASFEDGVDDNDTDDDDDVGTATSSTLPKIPSHQNVVRCPPINWAKYQIVGAPLDRMHEEQRRRPTPGQPAREDVSLAWQQQEHAVFAPYDPLKDRLEQQQQASLQQQLHPMQTRRGSKKPG